MDLRGSRCRFAVGTLCLVAATVPLWVSGATAAPPASNNAKTLQVSLPGPFNGCTKPLIVAIPWPPDEFAAWRQLLTARIRPSCERPPVVQG